MFIESEERIVNLKSKIKAGYLLEFNTGDFATVNYNIDDKLGFHGVVDGRPTYADIDLMDVLLRWEGVHLVRVWGRGNNCDLTNSGLEDRELIWEQLRVKVGDVVRIVSGYGSGYLSEIDGVVVKISGDDEVVVYYRNADDTVSGILHDGGLGSEYKNSCIYAKMSQLEKQ